MKKLNVIAVLLLMLSMLSGFTACASQGAAGGLAVAYDAGGEREAEAVSKSGEEPPLPLANTPQEVPAVDVAVFPQLGHSSLVTSVAFSPDGRWIVSGGGDTIKLWDAESSREIRTFAGHSGWWVYSVAFSPDGSRIVSGSADKTIKLWDAVTGREIYTFAGHPGTVFSVAFSPDGTQIVSGAYGGVIGSGNNTIKVWDAQTGQEIRTFAGHSDYVRSVAFSPDGNWIVSGSSDNTIKLWDVATGREIRTLIGHSSFVDSVAFSPNGKYIVSGSWDKNIKLWNTENGREIRTFTGHSREVFSVAFSPDGTQIVSGSWDKTINLWDSYSGKKILSLEGHIGGVNSVTFSPDGKWIVSGSGSEVNSVAFSSPKKYIVSGSDGNTIKLWDAHSGQEVRTFSEYSNWVNSVAFSPDGSRIVSGSANKTIKLWDAVTGREIRSLAGHSNRVSSVAFSPDGNRIASGSWGAFLKLWDTQSGGEIFSLEGYLAGVESVAFSPDGKRIVSGSYNGDKTINLWDSYSGRKILSLEGHIAGVNSVAFSPDGKWIISGSDDRTIKLWDAATGREIRSLAGYSPANSVAFSPNGKWIVSGGGDTIKLWDAESGHEIRTFSGHSGVVNSVLFTPDGSRLLSASNDGTTRLWDAATGKEIASFIGFTDGEWIVITPDGYYNASPKGDQYLNVRIGGEVYGVDQFAEAFYQPEVVQARLQGLPDPPVVKERGSIQTASVPPAVKGTVDEENAVSGQVLLSVTATDWIRQIRDIEIIVNGRLVGGGELRPLSARGLAPTPSRLAVTSPERQYEFTIPVSLEPGFNRIEVLAANDSNFGFKTLYVNSPRTEEQKSDLWVLAIGVNDYEDNPAYKDLDYAASDAKKIIAAFRGQEGKRFNKIHTRCVSDDEAIKPTRGNILTNMEFLKQAGPNDVVVLFISAHGKTEEGVYYFLPSDTEFTGGGKFDTASVVNIDDLSNALDIPGRKLVFLDTCESGGVDNNRLVRTLKNRSTVIFSASRQEEASIENALYGGLFTYSLIEGVSGKAAKSGGEGVEIEALGDYVSEQVEVLSRDRWTGVAQQHPTRVIPDGFKGFVIAE
jgi:WD40 repeat protein